MNYCFQVSFSVKVILYVVTITQNTITSFIVLVNMIAKFLLFPLLHSAQSIVVKPGFFVTLAPAFSGGDIF